MADPLSALEHRWRQTGATDDEARYLTARVRAGELSRQALEVAAWLGHPGAAAAAPEAACADPGRDPWAHLRAWADGLETRVAPVAEATWRAVLAEGEALLAAVAAGDALSEEAPTPRTRQALETGFRVQLDALTAAVAMGGEPRARALDEAARVADGVDLGALTTAVGVWLGRVGNRTLVTAIAAGAPARIARHWPADHAAAAKRFKGRATAVTATWPERVRRATRAALVPWILAGDDPFEARAAAALEHLEIASPCPMRWGDLDAVAEGVRSCARCEQRVYDIASLTRTEAAALLAAHEGQRLCVRLYRREDGRVLTRDCPDKLRAQLPVMGRFLPR